jgi:hypothetical protein
LRHVAGFLTYQLVGLSPHRLPLEMRGLVREWEAHREASRPPLAANEKRYGGVVTNASIDASLEEVA